MALSPEQQQKLREIVLKKIGTHPSMCPICGTRDFELGVDLVFFVLQTEFSQIKLAGDGLPCVPLTCKHCGTTQMMNAMVLGVMDLFKPPPPVTPAVSDEPKAAGG